MLSNYKCGDCGCKTDLVEDGFDSSTDGRQDTPTNYVTECCGSDYFEEWSDEDDDG